MLELKGISRSYGRVQALRGLDLTVPDGTLFGLMGQNGAGKTTLLKIIAGILAPDKGELFIDDVNALKNPAEARMKIGYVPDEFGSYDSLTVMEYMEFFASAFRMKGRTARVRCEELIRNVGLQERSDHPVETLSRGMQQRLSIARALIHDPEYLVLDEPTSGLDPHSRVSIREMLCELCDTGKTIVISSHILSELSEICTDMQPILERIGNSNPLRISVLAGTQTAMGIFRRHPCVRSVTLSDKTFSLEFEGGAEDEAALLMQLIDADIPVNGFMREPGTLESFFLQMTGKTEERLILSNDDDESDL